MIEVRLLGGITVSGSALPTRHARRLLALLVMHPRVGLSRSVLAEALWPGVPRESALQSLRKALQHVRSAVDVSAVDDRLVLSFQELWVDALAIEGVGAAEAVSLYAGPLGGSDAPDLAEEELDALWDNGWAIRLDDLHQRNLSLLARQALESGSRLDAEVWLEKAISGDRTDEEPYLSAMRLLDETGRPEDAIRIYRRLVTVLSSHKIPPSSEATDLGRQIRSKIRRVARSATPSEERKSWMALQALHSLQNPILGRESVISEVRAALASHRVVTLLGPGGIGKTRLALEVAGEMGHDLAFGAVWVDLSSVEGDVRGAVKEVEQLTASDALLVLDNCEHLIESVAELVTSLLHSSRRLTILATSRLALRLETEFRIEIPPLNQFHSGQLFEARSRQPAGEVFELTGGIPLAIELLAAADTKRDTRHSSMDAAIEGSLAACSPEERSLLAALSVIPGHFEESTIAALGGGAEALVTRSLLRRQGSSYCILPPIREYALRSLEPAERDRIEAKLADFASHHAQQTLDQLSGTRQAELPNAVAANLPLYRLAFSFLLRNDPGGALSLANSLSLGMSRLGRAEEGLAMMEQALLAAPDMGDLAQAKTLHAIGNLCKELGESRRAIEAYGKAAELYGKFSESRGVGACMVNSSFVFTDIGKYAEALECLRKATEAFDDYAAVADPRDLKFARMNVLKSRARIALHERDPDSARKTGAEGLALTRELGDMHSAAVFLNNLGDTELLDKQPEAALIWFQDALSTALELGDSAAIAFSNASLGLAHLALGRFVESAFFLVSALTAFSEFSQKRDLLMASYTAAGLAAATEKPGDALRLAGACEFLREKLEFAFSPASRLVVEPLLASAREQVGSVLAERYDLLDRGTSTLEIAKTAIRIAEGVRDV